MFKQYRAVLQQVFCFQPILTKPYQLAEPDKTSDSISEDDKFGDSFKDSRIRTKFIRKVYLILSVQLGFTTCFNIPFLYL